MRNSIILVLAKLSLWSEFVHIYCVTGASVALDNCVLAWHRVLHLGFRDSGGLTTLLGFLVDETTSSHDIAEVFLGLHSIEVVVFVAVMEVLLEITGDDVVLDLFVHLHDWRFSDDSTICMGLSSDCVESQVLVGA